MRYAVRVKYTWYFKDYVKYKKIQKTKKVSLLYIDYTLKQYFGYIRLNRIYDQNSFHVFKKVCSATSRTF